MIKIKNKTQLRKALRKNRKEKYLKINSTGNWHFLKVILLKLKTEKVVLKNSVAIPDKNITKLFKKWETELNKKAGIEKKTTQKYNESLKLSGNPEELKKNLESDSKMQIINRTQEILLYKEQVEQLEQENQKLKIELCQLKGVMESKDSQINLFKEEIKRMKKEFNKRLINEKEQVLELLRKTEV